MRGARLSISLLPIFLCAAFAQNATDRVIAEAQKTSALEANLQQLTDQIGGRVPGTPAMQKAVDWGVASFKAAGADSVHTEPFPSRQVGRKGQPE
jgi:carboxypeptidase Q